MSRHLPLHRILVSVSLILLLLLEALIDLLSNFIEYVLLEDAKGAVQSIVLLDIDRLYGSQDSEEILLEG